MKKILDFFKKERKSEIDVGPLHLYWQDDFSVHGHAQSSLPSSSRKHHTRLRIFFHKKSRAKFLLVLIALLVAAPFVYNRYYGTGKVAAADTYIKMDEGFGTSSAVNDSNGSVSAGSITGAVWRQEEFCKSGKCLYFDGFGDKVTYSDDADLNFVAADDFTITGWFRHPVIATNPDYLITKYSTAGYKIYMDSDGDLVFGVDDDSSWDTANLVGDDQSKNFDDNRWHHFAVQKDGTTGIYMYVDGNLIDSDTDLTGDTGTLSNTASFFIGIDADGSSNSWDGFIDEIKVTRSLLSASQIKADFLGSTPDRGTSASFGERSLGEILSDGLIGLWKMDETAADGCPTAGADSCDSSGNINDGTWNANVTPASGKFGTGTTFDGTGDYIDLGDIDL